MYKNKLVAEVNKEIEKENEAKALEFKKQKIRQMLSIIESKENSITKILEGIEIEKKEIVTLKEQLEKEDFSFLNKEYSYNVSIIGNGWFPQNSTTGINGIQ